MIQLRDTFGHKLLIDTEESIGLKEWYYDSLKGTVWQNISNSALKEAYPFCFKIIAAEKTLIDLYNMKKVEEFLIAKEPEEQFDFLHLTLSYRGEELYDYSNSNWGYELQQPSWSRAEGSKYNGLITSSFECYKKADDSINFTIGTPHDLYRFYLETLVLLERANNSEEISRVISAIDRELNEDEL